MAENMPKASRYVIHDDFATLRITIPARRSWFTVLFLGFWLTGWAAGEIVVGGLLLRGVLAMLRGQAPDVAEGGGLLFMGLWLAFWTVGGGFALVTWLWNIAGKETVVIDGEALTIYKTVLGLGPAKRYDAAYVDRLRASEDPADSQVPWSGGLAFDYGGNTVHFGAGLNSAEAREVLARIADRFPTLTRGVE